MKFESAKCFFCHTFFVADRNAFGISGIIPLLIAHGVTSYLFYFNASGFFSQEALVEFFYLW